MKIHTTRFGEMEIAEKDIVTFPEGIFGFEEITKYVVFAMEEGNPLLWMQALEEPALAFVLIQPMAFNPKYALEISEKDEEMLKLSTPEEADIFAIVVIPEDPQFMTANLQGPIVVNRIKKIGKQVISSNPKHKIKHYILKEMQKNLEHQEREE